MPAQTSKTANIYFPDGCKVAVQRGSGGSFVDVGAISGTVSATLNWDENQFESANAGKLSKQIKNMIMEGSFTLINLDPEAIAVMGAGIFTREIVTGSATGTVSNQVIAAGWTASAPIPMKMIAGGSPLVASTAPTLTSVTAATSGPLAAGDDYFVQPDSNSPSGYSIMFNTAGTAAVATTEVITINYASVTPVASVNIHAGTSTQVLTAYAMQITHTDSDGAVRSLALYSVDSNTGGFAFSFKGAEEDGVEQMELSFTAKLDTTRTDGRQLMTWSVPA